MKVEYYKDGVLAETTPVETASSWIGEAATVTVSPNTTDKFGKGYDYDRTEGALSYTVAAEADTDATTHVVKVYYEKNDVTHSVSARIEYYRNGELVETTETVTATGWIGEDTTVTVSPNTTNMFSGFYYDSTEGALRYTVPADAETDGTTHVVRVYYQAGAYRYTVNHIYVARDGSTEIGLTETDLAANGTAMSTLYTTDHTTYKGQNYVFDKVDEPEKTIGVWAADNVVNVYYDIDILGGDPTNPGDDIPDKFQAEVTFEVENGTTDIPSTVVTLYDKDGNPAEDGIGHLTPEQIPEVTANDGYDPDSLTWKDGKAPTTEIDITADTAFNGGFAELPVPAEPEVIEEPETPLAAPGAAWALVNLILTVLTVIGSVLMLLAYFKKKEHTVEDENGNETVDYTRKKKGAWKLASLIPAIGAVIAFVLTENMRNPMVLFDRWTVLMLVIALVQVVVGFLARAKKVENEEEGTVNA